MEKKKVLIVSFSYPPLNNIAARRFSEMVPYFDELGWEPYVLTTHSIGDLAPNLLEKNILRVSEHPQIKKEKVVIRKNSQRSSLRRQLGVASRSFDSSYRWYSAVFCSPFLEKLKKIDVDLILASYGPASSLKIGKELSKLLNVPWVADFRDLGALHRDDYDPRNIIFRLIDRVIEQRLIQSAASLTTVSKGLAEELERHYKKDVAVIYNGWKYADEQKQGSSNINSEIFTAPYIYYAGRFYEHRMEAIYILLQSLQTLDIIFVIRSLGPGKLNKKIIYMAEKLGVIDKVRILPPENESIIHAEQQNAVINLVVEDMSTTYTSKKGVLTGKFLQLLTYSAPILAIARKDSEIGHILCKTERGALHSSIVGVEQFIISILKEPSSYHLQTDQIIAYSKKSQARNLVEVFNSVLTEM